MAELEDDNFPNDFDGLDFDNVPGLQAPTVSRCTPHPQNLASPVSSSGSDDVEDMDSSFLAALDALEARALGKIAPGSESVSCIEPDAKGVSPSELVDELLNSDNMNINLGGHNNPCHVHECSVRLPDSFSASRKGKRKAEPHEDLDIRAVLEGYEADLTCPICCDLLAGAQVANPCGHTCCGECSYGWFVRNKYDPICAVCRTSLSTRRPLLPNFSVDNLVQQHIQALAKSGRPEWQDQGYKTIEWNKRLESWKRQAAARAVKEKSKETTRPRRRWTRAHYYEEYAHAVLWAVDESTDGDEDASLEHVNVIPRRETRSGR